MNNQISEGSFKKDSNYIYSSTEANWGNIRENSFVKVYGISGLFTVVGTSKNSYVKKFESLGNSVIEIKEDVSEVMSSGDVVKVCFKEYSVAEGFIKQAGEGYAVGDLLEVAEELASVDSFTGISNAAVVKVEEINGEGGVTRISFKNKGKYFLNSDLKEEFFVKGGYGSKAKIELSLQHNGQVKNVEKTVLSVQSKSIATLITLDSEFSQSVRNGELSFDKWAIETKHPLKEPSVINSQITITRDFTPFLKLPIIPGTSDLLEAHYNKAISIIDQKIEQLEKRINKL